MRYSHRGGVTRRDVINAYESVESLNPNDELLRLILLDKNRRGFDLTRRFLEVFPGCVEEKLSKYVEKLEMRVKTYELWDIKSRRKH